MFDERKKLIIVSGEKEMIYAELLSSLISMKDDNIDTKTVFGNPDGSVEAVVWNEKIYNDNKIQLGSNTKIIFIGRTKSSENIIPSINFMKFSKYGINGVQMATRFVTTYECDASNEFKEAYINAKEEDIKIISSPVGMPGRALYNEFIKSTENEKSKITKCYKCIKTCDIKNTPYCITKALINSVKGNLKEGLIFCGSNVDKVKELMTVHDLMEELAGV